MDSADETAADGPGFLSRPSVAAHHHRFRNVNTQIWIAISAYLLVAIMKKRLKIELTLYTILQILSISLFEKKLIYHLLTENNYRKQLQKRNH